jgi:dTMP kinase
MKGKILYLITLEGIDKSGKATQTQLLAKRLRKMGRKVRIISFPDYETLLGKVIDQYLHGMVDLCPEIRQLLYVANRWERVKDLVEWRNKGIIVIADRYSPSGLVYGLGNGLDLDWMINLEHGLPSSNLVIVIDVSVSTAFKRDETRDVYEKNPELLEKVRQSYLDLAPKFGWRVINGEKTIEEVAEQVWDQVSTLL